MTETLGPHTFANKDPLPPGKDGSFGFSVPGVEHKIVDPVTLEELPVGETGEVWMRGYSLMVGLHKRERADTFTPTGGTAPATPGASTPTGTSTSRAGWAT